MNKIFPKIDHKFYYNVIIHNQTNEYVFFFFFEKLMNMFSYSITTYFIFSNKDYYFCRNPHLVYQTYNLS